MEVGSWTDIGLLLCNMIMAWAALYAASSARKWFEKKVNDIGIKQTEKIILAQEKIVTDIILVSNNLYFLTPKNTEKNKAESGFKKKYIEQHVLELARNNESLNNNCGILHYLISSLEKFNLGINTEHVETVETYYLTIAKLTKKTRTFLFEYTNTPYENQEKIDILNKSMKEVKEKLNEFDNIKISNLISPKK
ncbi:hypothetical protein [Pectobacterium odoriferum]|uniref:hypothetical protein n=1 Tax=Pectobacterium odoriferum TaxID=78398 RepID=UPI0011AF4EF3|nr:hypothetical protein [Pectobacterium odoriferum]